MNSTNKSLDKLKKENIKRFLPDKIISRVFRDVESTTGLIFNEHHKKIISSNLHLFYNGHYEYGYIRSINTLISDCDSWPKINFVVQYNNASKKEIECNITENDHGFVVVKHHRVSIIKLP